MSSNPKLDLNTQYEPELIMRKSGQSVHERLAFPAIVSELCGLTFRNRISSYIRGHKTMTDVFISYSRKDTGFVRRLHDALAAQSRAAWVDWEDIPRAADWMDEINRGIDAADTF